MKGVASNSVGCPELVRMDHGTENVKVAECQIALRMGHTDCRAKERSIQYGSSPTNSVQATLIIVFAESSIFFRE